MAIIVAFIVKKRRRRLSHNIKATLDERPGSNIHVRWNERMQGAPTFAMDTTNSIESMRQEIARILKSP
jgi:hypothetical protein